MKLCTLFRVLCTTLFLLLIAFSVNLLGGSWSTYQCHTDTMQLLQTYKQAVMAMEQLSAERGYTNTFLGEGIAVISTQNNALMHVRASTDEAIDALVPALTRLPTTQRFMAVRNIRLLQQQLSANRKAIDALLGQHQNKRSATNITSLIERAIQQSTYIDNTIGILANRITRNTPSLIDDMQRIQTTTSLRDSAGQLGSILIPAIIKRQPLTEKELLVYAHIRQHIGDLHITLNQQLMMANDLPQHLFRQQKNRLENNYFRHAMRFTDSIAATGQASGNYPYTSGQFTDIYVANIASVVQLRKVLSTRLLEVAGAQKQHAYAMLLLHGGLCLFALLLLSVALHSIHKRMMMPILEASVLLSHPAETLYRRTPHPMYKTRDEASAMLLTLYAMRTGTRRTSTSLPTHSG